MTNFEKLRELAGNIATANAVTAVLRLRGHREANQAEDDLQDAWRQFDAQLSIISSDSKQNEQK